MTVSAEQQAALEKPVARVVYFAEFDFASGMQRVCTAMQSMQWGGHLWLGMGTIGGISAIEETGGMAPRALNFTINVAQQSWLTLAIGPSSEYCGRSAKLYMCPLDENFRLIGAPVRCWTGKMQTVAISAEGEEGKITLNCETSAFDLKRASGMRLNAAQHKKKYPTDQGLDYLNDLIAKPQTWLSKRFQQI